MNLGFTNHKHSEETKRKMSEDRKGENNSMYGKKRIMSEETRKKMSESHKGKVGVNKGKTWEEMYGVEKAKEMRKQLAKKSKGKNNPMYGKKRKFSEETKRRMSEGSKNTIKKIKKQYPLFSKIEEMRYNPDKPGEKEIQVHCKNHNCPNSKEQGGWFTPTKSQIYERIRQIENEDGNGGCYFYCSETCKQQCPLYHFHGTDPFKEKSKTLLYAPGELQTWKTQVKKLDNSTCQICGSKKNIHVHHIIPQKLEPFFALDPVNGICLCEKCHYKYGHKTNTECSTKNLASKTCIGDLYEATNYGC